jgi:hypothetical protein
MCLQVGALSQLVRLTISQYGAHSGNGLLMHERREQTPCTVVASGGSLQCAQRWVCVRTFSGMRGVAVCVLADTASSARFLSATVKEGGGRGGDSDCDEAMGVRGGYRRRFGSSRDCCQSFQGGR